MLLGFAAEASERNDRRAIADDSAPRIRDE
jgi:hypothetical protein